MRPAIRSIETVYNGYRFRSRLEARWAVFFDAIGVRYEYEPEGFITENGKRYLPDFWLPDLRYWIEIKPRDWGGDKELPLWELAREGAEAILLCGEPRIAAFPSEWNYAGLFGLCYIGYTGMDVDHFWCECPGCGALGIQYEGRAERNCHAFGCQYTDFDGKCRVPDTALLVAAYEIASQVRFEHGESPYAKLESLKSFRADLRKGGRQ